MHEQNMAPVTIDLDKLELGFYQEKSKPLPKKTTLIERLKFYEYAIVLIQNGGYGFLCNTAIRYFEKQNYRVPFYPLERELLFKFFPEVCKYKESDGYTMWKNPQSRLKALQKAVLDVQKKMKK